MSSASTLQPYEIVGYNSPSGLQITNAASVKSAFHGAVPVAQAAYVAQLSTSVVVTSGFGFSTSGQGVALTAAVNSILTVLINKGLMAAS